MVVGQGGDGDRLDRGVGDDEGVGEVAAGHEQLSRVNRLVESDCRQNVVDGDGGIVAVSGLVAFIIIRRSGHGVGVRGESVAADRAGEGAGVAVADADGLRQSTVALAVQVAVDIVNQRSQGDVFDAVVCDSDGEGDGVTRLVHIAGGGGLFDGDGGQNVVDGDGGIVRGRDVIQFVVVGGGGDDVSMAGEGVAVDCAREGAGVRAADGDGLRQSAVALAVKVAVNVVVERRERDRLAAGVGDGDGEVDGVARLVHVVGGGGLLDGDGGQDVGEVQGRVVVVGGFVEFVVNGGGGDHVGFGRADIAGDEGAEGAGVNVAKGDRCRHVAVAQAVQVAIDAVGQRGQDDIFDAVVGDGDEVAGRAAGFGHAGWVNFLFDINLGRDIGDGHGGAVAGVEVVVVVIGGVGGGGVGVRVAGIAFDKFADGAGEGLARGQGEGQGRQATGADVAKLIVNDAGDGHVVHQAGVLDDDGVDHIRARLVYRVRVRRLGDADGGGHVGDGDGGVVAVGGIVAFVVGSVGGDGVCFKVARVAGDGGGEGAGVNAAIGRNGAAGGAGAEAVEVAVDVVGQAVEGDRLDAVVGDDDRESDQAARLVHAGRVGRLLNVNGWFDVGDVDRLVIAVAGRVLLVVFHGDTGGVAVVAGVGVADGVSAGDRRARSQRVADEVKALLRQGVGVGQGGDGHCLNRVVGDSEREGETAAGFGQAGRAGRLVEGHAGQNVGDGDGGVVVSGGFVVLVVSGRSGDGVGVGRTGIAVDCAIERAGVCAAISRQSLRHRAVALAVQVAVHVVGQRVESDIFNAGIGHGDGEGDVSARLIDTGWSGVLLNSNTRRHIGDGDVGVVARTDVVVLVVVGGGSHQVCLDLTRVTGNQDGERASIRVAVGGQGLRHGARALPVQVAVRAIHQ